MTRSVEIPEAAVRDAITAFDDFEMRAMNAVEDQDTHLEDAMRAALEAALPYLVPAAETEGCTSCGYPSLYQGGCTNCGASAAPAGDGGLREALVKLADQYAATTHPAAHFAASDMRRLLAAHPAAPAVPQPVDREALIQALANEVRSWPDAASLPHHPDDAKVVLTFARLADAVLAVLAGEQEQTKR